VARRKPNLMSRKGPKQTPRPEQTETGGKGKLKKVQTLGLVKEVPKTVTGRGGRRRGIRRGERSKGNRETIYTTHQLVGNYTNTTALPLIYRETVGGEIKGTTGYAKFRNRKIAKEKCQ